MLTRHFAQPILMIAGGLLIMSCNILSSPLNTSNTSGATSTTTTELAIPTGLSIGFASGTTLTINWNPVLTATGYRLYRESSASASFTDQVYDGSRTSFTDTGLSSSHTYYYEVQSVDASATSGLSGPASGTTTAAVSGTPPATPTGLSVVSSTGNSITVSWAATSSATSYQLYRAASLSGSFSDQVYSGNSTSYRDTGLAEDTTYYYEVQASNATGSSLLSASINATTLLLPPATPGGLSMGSTTRTTLALSWAAVSRASSYDLYRSTSATGPFTQRVYAGSTTNYVDTGLSTGTTYYYEVAATNSAGTSALSPPVSGTPPYTIYATLGAILGQSTGGSVTISTDGGTTWATNLTSGMGGFDGVYAINSTVYAGGGSNSALWISTNGGSTWTSYLANDSVDNVYVVGSTIYAAADGGLWISTDNGSSWTQYLSGYYIKNVIVANSTIYAAAYGSGIFVSTNNGSSWSLLTTSNGLVSNYVEYVYVSGSNIYTATDDGLSVSMNGGSTWKTYGNTVLGAYRINSVFALGSDIYAATAGYGLSVTTNGGTTWTNYSTGQGLAGSYVNVIYGVGSTVFCGTSQGLSVSVDNGATWSTFLAGQNVDGVYAR